MSVHLPVLFRDHQNWSEHNLTSQQREELKQEKHQVYASVKNRKMSFSTKQAPSPRKPSGEQQHHEGSDDASSPVSSPQAPQQPTSTTSSTANTARGVFSPNNSTMTSSTPQQSNKKKVNPAFLTALAPPSTAGSSSTRSATRTGSRSSARGRSSSSSSHHHHHHHHHEQQHQQQQRHPEISHPEIGPRPSFNAASSTPYVSFGSTVTHLPEFLSPSGSTARALLPQQLPQEGLNSPGAPSGRSRISPSRGGLASSSSSSTMEMATAGDLDVYDLTHMNSTSKRIGYLCGGGPGGMTPRGVLRHSIRSPLDQAVWKAPPPQKHDAALERARDVNSVRALDSFDTVVPTTVPISKQKPLAPPPPPEQSPDSSPASSPVRGNRRSPLQQQHHHPLFESSSDSDDQEDDGRGRAGSTAHRRQPHHHLRAQTNMHDGPEHSPLPFVAIMQGLYPSVSPQTFLTRYINFVGARRPKSPVLWSSIVPAPEDSAHHRMRHGRNPLYVNAVTHDRELFRDLLADTSSAPTSSFTEGFCTTVLHSLAQHDTASFDVVVKLVSDQCRKNEEVLQATMAGVQNPSAPPPRSQLVQTKTMFHEAEVMQRETRMRDDMMAGSVVSGNKSPQQPQQQGSMNFNNNNSSAAHPLNVSISGGSSSNHQHHGGGRNSEQGHHQQQHLSSSSSRPPLQRSRSNSMQAGTGGSGNFLSGIARRDSGVFLPGSPEMKLQQSQPSLFSQSGPLLSIREVFRAFTDATLEPTALRNIMVVLEHFDPHECGFIPHYAFITKDFLLKYFLKTVPNPTLSQKANWENFLGVFETVRAETEGWVRGMEAKGGISPTSYLDADSNSGMPIYAWFLAALVGPKCCPASSSNSGAVRSPMDILKILFAKHYDKLPPPVPIPMSDLRMLLLCDDRLVHVVKNYTIPTVEPESE